MRVCLYISVIAFTACTALTVVAAFHLPRQATTTSSEKMAIVTPVSAPSACDPTLPAAVLAYNECSIAATISFTSSYWAARPSYTSTYTQTWNVSGMISTTTSAYTFTGYSNDTTGMTTVPTTSTSSAQAPSTFTSNAVGSAEITPAGTTIASTTTPLQTGSSPPGTSTIISELTTPAPALLSRYVEAGAMPTSSDSSTSMCTMMFEQQDLLNHPSYVYSCATLVTVTLPSGCI